MHFIFTVPSILDLCSIYGNSNGPLLSKMVKNIFDKQPQYKEDLNICVKDVNKVREREERNVYGIPSE